MRRPTCFHVFVCAVTLATCFFLVGPSGARAELFPYEGFDYPADFLLGSDGGFGFDGPYERTNDVLKVGVF